MSIVQKIIFFVTSALSIIPGILVISLFFRERTRSEAFFLGALLNFIAIIYFGRLFSLKLIPIFVGIEYAVALLLLFISRVKKDFFSNPPSQKLKEDYLVWVIAVLTFWVWWLPAVSGILPMGTDSMSNVLLISKTLLTEKLPTDWTPFEAIEINMATGSHYLTAFFAWLTNLPSHSAYKLLFPLIAFLTSGTIYFLTKELYNNKKAALISSVLWAMSARWGGMDYLKWGDMPNFLAMLMLLGALWVIISYKGKKRTILLAIFLTGVILINYLSAFVGFIILTTFILCEITLDGKITSTSKEIFWGILLTVLLLPFTLLKEISNLVIHYNDQTEIFKMPEFFIPIQDIPRNLGYMVFLLGSISLIFAIIKMKDRREILIPVWTGVILLVLAICGYFYRAMSFGLHGEFYALFRPSRILMDLSYPLCIASGWFLAVDKSTPLLKSALLIGIYLIFFFVLLKVHPFVLSKEIFENPALYVYIGYPIALISLALAIMMKAPQEKPKNIAVALMIILLAMEGVYRSLGIAASTGNLIKLADLHDMNILKNSIPAEKRDALIINYPSAPDDFSIYGWLPYWTSMECTWTPLLYSEARLAGKVKYKRDWLQHNIHEAIVWSHIEARPIVAITGPSGDLNQLGFESISKGQKRKVFLYDPAKH